MIFHVGRRKSSALSDDSIGDGITERAFVKPPGAETPDAGQGLGQRRKANRLVTLRAKQRPFLGAASNKAWPLNRQGTNGFGADHEPLFGNAYCRCQRGAERHLAEPCRKL